MTDMLRQMAMLFAPCLLAYFLAYRTGHRHGSRDVADVTGLLRRRDREVERLKGDLSFAEGLVGRLQSHIKDLACREPESTPPAPITAVQWAACFKAGGLVCPRCENAEGIDSMTYRREGLSPGTAAFAYECPECELEWEAMFMIASVGPSGA